MAKSQRKKRTKIISFRVTEAQYASIYRVADALEMGVSEWCAHKFIQEVTLRDARETILALREDEASEDEKASAIASIDAAMQLRKLTEIVK